MTLVRASSVPQTKRIATAAVDHLLHHAHLVVTNGDSHRLAQAMAGKGVVPLN